ncbi:hypothetical protein ACF0H5_022650 [Mactra antiquata]
MEELPTISKNVDQCIVDETLHDDVSYHVTDNSTNQVRAQQSNNTKAMEETSSTLTCPSILTSVKNNDCVGVNGETEIILDMRKIKYQGNTLKKSILRKNQSEPSLHTVKPPVIKDMETRKFVYDTNLMKSKYKHRQSFADVVTEVLTEPIKEDLHPYGRGHLYRSTIYGEYRTKPFRNDEMLLMWAVAALLILGIACGIIVMSVMYQKREALNTINLNSTINMTISE